MHKIPPSDFKPKFTYIEDQVPNLPEPVPKESVTTPQEIGFYVGSLIARGLSKHQACLMADITTQQLDHLAKSNPSVQQALEKAEAAFLDYATAKIARGHKGWQALAWILERRYPNHWKRELTINLPQVSNLKQLSDQDLQRLLNDSPQHDPT